MLEKKWKNWDITPVPLGLNISMLSFEISVYLSLYTLTNVCVYETMINDLVLAAPV